MTVYVGMFRDGPGDGSWRLEADDGTTYVLRPKLSMTLVEDGMPRHAPEFDVRIAVEGEAEGGVIVADAIHMADD